LKHSRGQIPNLRLKAIANLEGLEYPTKRETWATVKYRSCNSCLYAEVIAVPAYPPQNRRNTPRIEAIIADAKVAIAEGVAAPIAKRGRSPIALTTKTLLPKMQSLLGNLQSDFSC
jgi:hypothetical protein